MRASILLSLWAVADCSYHSSDGKSREDDDSPETKVMSFEETMAMEGKGVFSRCIDPKHAAITFDDGIFKDKTPLVLDEAKRLHIKLTFFILGQSISKFRDLDKKERNPDYKANREILKRMVKEGHQVGSHTFSHPTMTDLSIEEAMRQVDETAKLIKRVIGVFPTLFRFPEGKMSRVLVDRLRERGNNIVQWTVDPEDWKDSSLVKQCFRQELSRCSLNKFGPIILVHDFTESKNNLSDFKKKLEADGYKIRTIGECLNVYPYQLEYGKSDERKSQNRSQSQHKTRSRSKSKSKHRSQSRSKNKKQKRYI